MGEFIKTEHLWETILHGISIPVLLISRDLKILWANKAFQEQCGCTLEEIIGNYCYKLTHHRDSPCQSPYDLCPVSESKKIGGTATAIHTHFDNKGNKIFIEASAYPVKDEKGETEQFVCMYRDITEMKRFEEELRKAHDELEIKVQERTVELSRTNELLERMFSSIHVLIAYMDRYFNFIKVNKAYADADNRMPEFFPGKNHFDLYPNKENEANFRKVVETGEPYIAYAKPFEYAEHPERGVSYWDWNVQPVKDVDGKITGVVLSLLNETDRIKAQQAINLERQRLYDILENLPVYVVLLTPDYHMPFSNRIFRETFGESHGRRCFEYLFGRTEPCEICETYSVLKTMKPHEWEWTGPNGRNYYIYDFPFTDTDGSTLILEMGIDITERKKAENELWVSERKYRSLVEQASDGILIFDNQFNVIDVNSMACQMLGFSKDELLHLNVRDLAPSEEHTDIPAILSELLSGETMLSEIKARRKEGALIDVEISVKMLEDGRIQTFLRDITERKEVENRINVNNALLRFFVQTASRKDYLDRVVELIQQWSGFHSLGIRILDKDGFIPYESHTGFSEEFLKTENMLSVKSSWIAPTPGETGLTC